MFFCLTMPLKSTRGFLKKTVLKGRCHEIVNTLFNQKSPPGPHMKNGFAKVFVFHEVIHEKSETCPHSRQLR